MSCQPRVPSRTAPFAIPLIVFLIVRRRATSPAGERERGGKLPAPHPRGVAAKDRRQQLHRKASPLQLQDIGARLGVRLDIRDPADLPARKKPRVDPLPAGDKLPGLLADSEAGSDAPSFHAARLPQSAKGALWRIARAGS